MHGAMPCADRKHTMNDISTSPRWQVRAARRARKDAQKAARAKRAAAIEAAWVAHMWQATPAEMASARAAEMAAETVEAAGTATGKGDAVNGAEKRSQSAPQWPDGLPRPNPGHRYPAVVALARWLGLEYRRFEPREVHQMVSTWVKLATEHGVFTEDPTDPMGRAAVPFPRKPYPRPGRVTNLGRRD